MIDKKLDAMELAALRGGYDPAVMNHAVRNALKTMHPAGDPWIGAMFETLYLSGPLKPVDRERCLIAVLAARGGATELAIHSYWGLMEGIEVEELKHILFAAGVYAGAPCYAMGLLIVQKLIGVLEVAVDEKDVSAGSVLNRMLAAFPH